MSIETEIRSTPFLSLVRVAFLCATMNADSESAIAAPIVSIKATIVNPNLLIEIAIFEFSGIADCQRFVFCMSLGWRLETTIVKGVRERSEISKMQKQEKNYEGNGNVTRKIRGYADMSLCHLLESMVK